MTGEHDARHAGAMPDPAHHGAQEPRDELSAAIPAPPAADVTTGVLAPSPGNVGSLPLDQLPVAPLASCWACDGWQRGEHHARADCPVVGPPTRGRPPLLPHPATAPP